MEDVVFWGITVFFCLAYSVVALDVLRIKVPVRIIETNEFLFSNLYFPVLCYITEAYFFGMLPGLIMLFFQMAFGVVFGIVTFAITVLLLEIQSAPAKIRDVVRIFWQKQFRLL